VRWASNLEQLLPSLEHPPDPPFCHLERSGEIWLCGGLAISNIITYEGMGYLEFIHNNPILPKWKLPELPENYKYSSAMFYYCGKDAFDLVTD